VPPRDLPNAGASRDCEIKHLATRSKGTDGLVAELVLCFQRDPQTSHSPGLMPFTNGYSRDEPQHNKSCFFLTKEGHMGIEPDSGVARDFVFTLLGGHIPFILQPRKGSKDAGHKRDSNYIV